MNTPVPVLTYARETVPGYPDSYGTYNIRNRTIRLALKNTDRVVLTTLIHEYGHALIQIASPQMKDSQQEQFCNLLELFVWSLIKENPSLLSTMMKHVREQSN